MTVRPAPVATLDDVVAELRAIRKVLERQQCCADSSLSRADRATLARLLPAIGGAVGSELFSSAEICAHTAAAVRLVCAGLTVKQLGKLLARATDKPIDGYLVQREGTEAGAVLWRIVQVPEFLRVSKPFHSSRDVSRDATIDGEE